MNTYEGLFLLQSVEAKRDWDAATAHVGDILKKAGGKIGTHYRWDERKLAYEIAGQKRGAYYLVYFECEAGAITGIRRDCTLSEIVMRQLITRLVGAMPPMPTEEELARHHAELAAVSGPGRPSRPGRR